MDVNGWQNSEGKGVKKKKKNISEDYKRQEIVEWHDRLDLEESRCIQEKGDVKVCDIV